MTIELKPEHQRMIDLAIQSGAYHDPGEVLDQAFANWRSTARIAEGFAQAERRRTDGR